MRTIAWLACGLVWLHAGAAAAGVDEGEAAFASGDFAAAEREWRPLAEAGDAKAQFRLGNLYELGGGVPEDMEQAKAWYRKAAEQGHSEATLTLGLIYADSDGQGLKQDPVLAWMLLELARRSGESLAVFRQNLIADALTPAQRAEAERLAAEWKPGTPLPAER